MADIIPLRKAVKEVKKILIAFSGGLDSTVLAKLAVEELGENALAVTVDSETLPASELEACKNLADEVGIRLVIINHTDLNNAQFTKNPIDRCYHCRRGLAEILQSIADDNGISVIADGANSSDLGDYRPGLKAFDEAGIWHPFIEFGFDKDAIRKLAGELNLSIKEKPSMACLASRIPYHEEITYQKLKRIEEAEDFIKSLNFSQVRVRHLKGEVARIEVLVPELGRILEPSIRDQVILKLKDQGFKYITFDLEGYRTGSMNIDIKRRENEG